MVVKYLKAFGDLTSPRRSNTAGGDDLLLVGPDSAVRAGERQEVNIPRIGG